MRTCRLDAKFYGWGVGGRTEKGMNGDSWLQYTTHSCPAQIQMTASHSPLKSSHPGEQGGAQATRHISSGRKQLKAQGQIVSEGSNVNRVWLVRPAVLPAAAAPAKYFGPTRPPDSRSRPDQPTRHQSAVALRPVTDAGRRRAAAAACRVFPAGKERQLFLSL